MDPNGTGLSVESEARFFGSKLDVAEPCFDLATRYGDGMSVYGYLQSVPWGRDDPMGLVSATDVGMLFVPTPTDFITGMLQEVVEEYASNQEWDVDWATDWDQGDDWSTREDNSWIEEAMLRGLYNSFEISIPGTNIGFNPIDTFAGAYSSPTSSHGSRGAWSKPIQGHHIATKDGAFGAENKVIFARAGMKIDDPANKVAIPHSGRHSPEYHKFVQKRIKAATDGLSVTEAERALKTELKSLEDFVAKNPHFLYNTVKGAKTGWKGLREMNIHMHGGRYRYRPRR
jgi:hypothetical protein